MTPDPQRPVGGPSDPGRPTLQRPPGERYRERSIQLDASAPDLRRGITYGLAAALGTAVAIGLLGGLLDLTLGIVIVGLAGGWVIGQALASGTWPAAGIAAQERRQGSTGIRVVAALLGIVAVALGLVVHWLVALIAIPEASRGLAERIASQPIIDWLQPQLDRLGPGYVLAAIAAAAAAWRTAR